MKNLPKFNCNNCNYKCSKKSEWTKHISTQKHIRLISANLDESKNLHIICKCGRQYKHMSSLCKHRRFCSEIYNIKSIINDDSISNIVLEVVKNNNDIQKQYVEMHKQNQEFQQKMMESFQEVCKSNIVTNNNITQTNSNNKTFNLQIFLNETCKDAMNMSEFIDSMKIQLSDLESVGKLGFVDGISNIIINNLKALDIEKRPVHCSDAKRETMYIKDHDKWEKEDDELNKMKQMVKQVRDKNISLITSWRDLYPECLLSNSKKTDQYNKICTESFGFKKEREEKIISKIAKSVIIDKK